MIFWILTFILLTLFIGRGVRLHQFKIWEHLPDQIVVRRYGLHFLGVQGPHHVITVEEVGTFPLDRGHMHTVSEVAY